MKLQNLDIIKQKYDLKVEELKRFDDEVKFSNLITSDFIPLNIWLVRYLGLDATLFLSAAYEEVMFFRSLGKEPTEWISLTKSKIKSKTGLGAARQQSAIEVLKNKNLIEVRNTEFVPKVRQIKFNYSEVNFLIEELEVFKFKESELKRKKRRELQEKLTKSLSKKYEEDFKSRHDGLSSAEWYELQETKLQETRECLEKEIQNLWETANPGKSYKEYVRQQFQSVFENSSASATTSRFVF